MVITFMPATDRRSSRSGPRRTSRSAAHRASYWLRIAFPVLAPSFLGSAAPAVRQRVLVLRDGRGAHRARARRSSRSRSAAALTSETVLGRQNVAGVLALGMIIVMVVVMFALLALQRRASRWQR